MAKSLFYSGVILIVALALDLAVTGMGLLAGGTGRTVAPIEAAVALIAIIPISALVIRFVAAVAVRNLYVGLAAAVALTAAALASAVRLSLHFYAGESAALAFALDSAILFCSAILLLTLMPYFELRMGSWSWLFALPSITYLASLVSPFIAPSIGPMVIGALPLVTAASLLVIATHSLRHRRQLFEPVLPWRALEGRMGRLDSPATP